MLVWLGATESNEIQLRKEAKKMGLTLSRNRDQNTYIGVVASFLLQNKVSMLLHDQSLCVFSGSSVMHDIISLRWLNTVSNLWSTYPLFCFHTKTAAADELKLDRLRDKSLYL